MLNLSVKLYEDCNHYVSPHLKCIVDKFRKHWTLYDHCDDTLLPKPLTTATLTTDESKFYWYLYNSKGKFDKCLQEDIKRLINTTIIKGVTWKFTPVNHILISERLIDLERLDVIGRRNFLRHTVKFIRKQCELEIACLEGLKLTRVEGYIVLSALSSSKKTIKFLHIWRLFKRHEYCQLEEEGTSFTLFPHENLFLEYHWLRAIACLRYLETISLNYSYVASDSGDVLINIAKRLLKRWKCLQLLCLKDDIPDTVNVRGELNAVTIPDFAWTKARKFSPYLKVHIVIHGIREYHMHKRFLTPSIPMQAIVLSTNKELLFHKPCMIDCTLKTIYLFYHRFLTELCLTLWNHREALDYHLRKIFPCLPNIKVFEFVGAVQDPITICTMCCQINLGVCAVKRVFMLIQKSDVMKKDDVWITRAQCILENFKDDFEADGIDFKIDTYLC